MFTFSKNVFLKKLSLVYEYFLHSLCTYTSCIIIIIIIIIIIMIIILLLK